MQNELMELEGTVQALSDADLGFLVMHHMTAAMDRQDILSPELRAFHGALGLVIEAERDRRKDEIQKRDSDGEIGEMVPG